MVSRLSQVARQARRSESTVSRVLNGHGRASPSTVTAVLTALDVLGFERPPSMRGEPRPRIVGLVLPDLRNPTFPAFADLLTVELLRHGLICALCTRTADGVSEAEHVEMLLAHDTAGIIFVGSSFADAGAKQGRALRQRRIPTVLINPADDNPTRARVSIDDAQAVRLALWVPSRPPARRPPSESSAARIHALSGRPTWSRAPSSPSKVVRRR